MKRIQIQNNGIRQIQSKAGCNSCQDCKHCQCGEISYDKWYYFCLVQHKSSIVDKNFPYDNTKCKEFKDGTENQQ